VQSEDDEGDCTEMAQMMNHLGLTEAQKENVARNSELIRCNDLVGFKFIEALRERLQTVKDDGHPFDLVIINPYSVYLGTDVKDTEACTRFLNQWLNPILTEFDIAAILIHHRAKTNFQTPTNTKSGIGCITEPAAPALPTGLEQFWRSTRNRRSQSFPVHRGQERTTRRR
jgi:RecA-family ATPase